MSNYSRKPLNRFGVKTSKICIAVFLLITILFAYYFAIYAPGLTKKATDNKIHRYVQSELQHLDFTEPQPVAFHGQKIVHLDLKGAPPRISYYSKLFPLLSKLGADGILIEYEDMFPFSGPYAKNISAFNAYTIEDVETINTLAKSNNLKVIPLVQTFGHLEFILKLEDYKNLREVLLYPQVICPTNEHTISLITDMLDQVIAAHPGIEMIHIGMDEVYYLGMCDRCTNAMYKENLTSNLLFLKHLNNITEYISSKYPDLRILIWDDQFRSISKKELKKFHTNRRIEPVVWKYTKDVYDELGPSLWDFYSKLFPKVWIASAFKGATGSNQFVSDVTHYLQNHRSWLSVLSEYKYVNFEGIIITGWQRYDHFAVLCELLPVGIPTLAMSLRLLSGKRDSPLSPPKDIARVLGCQQPYGLIGHVFGTPKCSYPGADILENVLRLQQLKLELEGVQEDSRVKGWMTEYNIRNSFSNPRHVEQAMSSLSRIKVELNQIDSDISDAMFEIYDNYTIDEWREVYIKPLSKKVNELSYAKERLLSKVAWPRRPLQHDNSDL